MAKNNKTNSAPLTTEDHPVDEEEVYANLMYNFYNYGGIHITVENGGTVVFQAGKPQDPPPPPDGPR